ncbi:hypothetical protein M1583_03105, partial [Candidatus Marsarchaeota archaeon]|nr:hypothetical protein [Candidatus Marsarchaeota archaeon]
CFLGSLVVAIMFITSYAASGGGNNSSSTTTIAYNYSGAVPMVGTANAVVVNYTSSPVVELSPKGYNSTALGVTDYLNSLVSKGYAVTYTPNGNQFNVLLSNNFTAYQLQSAIASRFGSNATVKGTVYIRLPKSIKMYDGTSGYVLTSPTSEYSVVIEPLPYIGSNVSVKVLALITAKGQFAPNQTEVTLDN